MRNDNAIRIGILGAAKIAPLAIAEPCADFGDAKILAVASRHFAKALEFTSRHGGEPMQGYESLLAREDIDLIYVALPPAFHREWSVRALDSGKPVLCEKPFARNAVEASEMVDASKKAGLPLLEAMHYRYHSGIRDAIELLRSGELGTVRSARAQFCLDVPRTPDELRWRSDLGGGALADLGCYAVHALRTFLGTEPQVRNSSLSMRHGVDYRVEANLEFPGGTSASFFCSMVAPDLVWDLSIEGSRGSLNLSNFVAPQFGSTLTVDINGDKRVERLGGPSSYSAQLYHVAEVLRFGAAPLTGGCDAIANLAVMDDVRSLATEHSYGTHDEC